MINSTIVVRGFAADLPALHRRKFEFIPGLNVLFGSNGCGKSVLLKCTKAYCALKHGGWSKISRPEEGHLPSGLQQHHFPQVYKTYTPNGDCESIVEWDGSPAFYNDSDMLLNDMSWFYNPDLLKQEGLTTEAEQWTFATNKPSSGQTRILKLNKIMDILKCPPEFSTAGAEGAYINSLPRSGKVTIMLDEPEKSLSIPKQIEMFNFLAGFQNDVQIIIATHSPFVLFQENANIIEMIPGYIDECKNAIKDCAAKLQPSTGQLNLF